ncbi:RICIN domain-containing protein [Nonomuraea jiangxiensis]
MARTAEPSAAQAGPASGEPADPSAGNPPAQRTGESSAADLLELRNQWYDLCMSARGGAGERPVFVTTCGGWLDQRWVREPIPNSPYTRFRNYALQLCLAARGNTAAVATTCGTGAQWPDQLWVVLINDWGNYQLGNAASGLCLGVSASGEAPVRATTCADRQDQTWMPYP